MADITKPINITATPLPASIPTNSLGNVGVSNGALAANLPTVVDVSGKADVTTIAVAIHGLGEENIPDPRLFKFLADKFGVSETTLIRAYKQVLETIRGSDISSTVVKKVLQEVRSILEELRISTKTSKYDQISKLDTFSTGITKPFTEVIARSDSVLNKAAGKSLLEAKTISDIFSKQIGITLAEIDYWLQGYGIDGYTERAVHLSDILSRVVSYTRTFTDTVDATDDFYGIANIDDDQIASFGKRLSEYAQASEVFLCAATYNRSHVSNSYTSDTKSFQSRKQVLDTKNVSDSNTKMLGKYLQDNTATSKLIQLNVQNYSLDKYAAVGYVGQTFVY